VNSMNRMNLMNYKVLMAHSFTVFSLNARVIKFRCKTWFVRVGPLPADRSLYSLPMMKGDVP
jgi:hypothetical protein